MNAWSYILVVASVGVLVSVAQHAEASSDAAQRGVATPSIARSACDGSNVLFSNCNRQHQVHYQGGWIADKFKVTYDFTFDINSLNALLNGDPWDLYWPQTFQSFCDKVKKSESRKFIIASAIGRFNRGKSFLINKITEIPIVVGDVVHTVGLSGLLDEKLGILWIDAAGSRMPVDPTPDKMRDRQATDALLQDAVFHLSQINMVLLDKLTKDDLIYIEEFYERRKLILKNEGALQKKAVFQYNDAEIRRLLKERMLIVHNLRHCSTEEEVEQVIERDIVGIFSATADNPGLRLGKNWPIYVSDRFYHVILARDGTAAGNKWNGQSIEYLRHRLTFVKPGVLKMLSAKELVPEMLKSVSGLLNTFADTTNTPPTTIVGAGSIRNLMTPREEYLELTSRVYYHVDATTGQTTVADCGIDIDHACKEVAGGAALPSNTVLRFDHHRFELTATEGTACPAHAHISSLLDFRHGTVVLEASTYRPDVTVLELVGKRDAFEVIVNSPLPLTVSECKVVRPQGTDAVLLVISGHRSWASSATGKVELSTFESVDPFSVAVSFPKELSDDSRDALEQCKGVKNGGFTLSLSLADYEG